MGPDSHQFGLCWLARLDCFVSDFQGRRCGGWIMAGWFLCCLVCDVVLPVVIAAAAGGDQRCLEFLVLIWEQSEVCGHYDELYCSLFVGNVICS